METELKLVITHLQTIVAHIRTLEKEITILTDAFLAEWSGQLNLPTPLTVEDFPWGRHIAIGTLLAEIGVK